MDPEQAVGISANKAGGDNRLGLISGNFSSPLLILDGNKFMMGVLISGWGYYLRAPSP